ncbi:hypothetical protein CYMTET_32291, partial [Cymbomonas tetramitiformis]
PPERVQCPPPGRAQCPPPERAQCPPPELAQCPPPERAQCPPPELGQCPPPERAQCPPSRSCLGGPKARQEGRVEVMQMARAVRFARRRHLHASLRVWERGARREVCNTADRLRCAAAFARWHAWCLELSARCLELMPGILLSKAHVQPGDAVGALPECGAASGALPEQGELSGAVGAGGAAGRCRSRGCCRALLELDYVVGALPEPDNTARARLELECSARSPPDEGFPRGGGEEAPLDVDALEVAATQERVLLTRVGHMLLQWRKRWQLSVAMQAWAEHAQCLRRARRLASVRSSEVHNCSLRHALACWAGEATRSKQRERRADVWAAARHVPRAMRRWARTWRAAQAAQHAASRLRQVSWRGFMRHLLVRWKAGADAKVEERRCVQLACAMTACRMRRWMCRIRLLRWRTVAATGLWARRRADRRWLQRGLRGLRAAVWEGRQAIFQRALARWRGVARNAAIQRVRTAEGERWQQRRMLQGALRKWADNGRAHQASRAAVMQAVRHAWCHAAQGVLRRWAGWAAVRRHGSRREQWLHRRCFRRKIREVVERWVAARVVAEQKRSRWTKVLRHMHTRRLRQAVQEWAAVGEWARWRVAELVRAQARRREQRALARWMEDWREARRRPTAGLRHHQLHQMQTAVRRWRVEAFKALQRRGTVETITVLALARLQDRPHLPILAPPASPSNVRSGHPVTMTNSWRDASHCLIGHVLGHVTHRPEHESRRIVLWGISVTKHTGTVRSPPGGVV